MKLLLTLFVPLLICGTVQAKFPAEGLIKTASSGIIKGKAVLMKAEDADLVDSKLAKINSNKFIASMAKKDSGGSWEVNIPNDGEYIIETWYTFPWTASASAQYELKCGSSAPFLWKVPTSGGGAADGGIYHIGRMNLTKGKQTFTLKKKGRDGIYLRYIRLIPAAIFPVVQPGASGKITLLPENCLVTRALAKDVGKFIILSHFNSVSWDIYTKEEGTYTVTTDYAIASAASTLFKIGYSVNDQLTEFTFPGTGGWSRFVKYSPGTLTLPPGKCTLTIKGITSGAETKSVVLTPAP
ncbi:hypothetical protein [Akkermansia sp.]|uniref:hypothetical protein n=1 Tax=Akkermansia sp. TaxID=1872421 RepID=UPI0025B92FF4|nr:hypothetical protein [Akkermansia sp.]MCC8149709.1 hypothetical protein [Akkermansia sp.]